MTPSPGELYDQTSGGMSDDEDISADAASSSGAGLWAESDDELAQHATPAENQSLHVRDDVNGNTGQSTPLSQSEDLLPRDRPTRHAFYDSAHERQMGQAEAKQIYQRHQLENQSIADGSQTAQSPILRASSFPALSKEPETAHQRRGTASRYDGASSTPAGIPIEPAPESYAHHQARLLQADQAARDHAIHPALPHEKKPPLLEGEGVHGAGAGIGVGAGNNGFATNDFFIQSELSAIYGNITRILDIRHKYIRLSLQGAHDNPKDEPSWEIYPPPPEPVWEPGLSRRVTADESLASSSVFRRSRKPGMDIGSDFQLEDLLHSIPGKAEMHFDLDSNGVYQVYETSKSAEDDAPIVHIPTLREYYMDLDAILTASSDGPSKSKTLGCYQLRLT